MTESEYRDLISARSAPSKNEVKKKSKYRSTRTQVDGIWFDSKKEADRFCDLKILIQAGEVDRVFRQVPIDLPGGVIYKLDFMTFWVDGKITYEDVKGFDTPVSKLKRKQVEHIYKIKIELT